MGKSYKRLRREAYPAEGEQLDAIWKALNQMRLEGMALPQDTDDMLGKVLAVKNKYPKPDKAKDK